MPHIPIKRYVGQTIFVVFSFLAFVSLAGAAVTIGQLGTPNPASDTAAVFRQAAIATGMSLVFFAIGYFARNILCPTSRSRAPE
jgi:hypothetical protein